MLLTSGKERKTNMKLARNIVIALVGGATVQASNFEVRSVLPEPSENSESILWTRNGHEELVHFAKEAHLTESHVAGASIKDTLEGVFYVEAQLTDQEKEALARATRKAKGGRLAILVKDEILSVPTVRREISGGSFVITGGFTHGEAEDIAAALNSAADRNGRTDRER